MLATRRGTNRITKILNGCAVSEDWRDADGTRGMSLFYYQPAALVAGTSCWTGPRSPPRRTGTGVR